MSTLRFEVAGRRAVLGVDAAWTAEGSSGVALVCETVRGAWECVSLAAGYEAFIAAAPGADPAPAPSLLAAQLVEAARRYAPGATLTVIAVDMPLSLSPITGRRAADDAVSRAFGRAKCSTHTPSAVRPGVIADQLRAEFDELGFPLATAATLARAAPRLIEVYPHPALLDLCAREERMPYKVAKARRYWPSLSSTERGERLLEQHREIVAALERGGITNIPPDLLKVAAPVTARRLKSIEDQIDALVCAWVGTRYLAGDARAYGDEQAAIWIPPRA